MKKILTIAIVCFSLCLTFKVNAQPPTGEEIKAQFIKDWERAKAYTVDYLNTMPANKYSFKAHDSIRSFAQQMLHLAQANVGLLMGAVGEPLSFARANLEGSPTAQTKDSVMYYVTASYDYCINAVKTFDLAKWGETKQQFGFTETRYALMIKTFEHQTHHRGQATIYIRLQGIRPPQEQLF